MGNKHWTQEMVDAFVAFIESNGGKVTQIYALMNGYQFDIRPPSTAAIPNWGSYMMAEFVEGLK
jgi:hypothetical protein